MKIIYGRKPVIEALQSETNIEQIFIAKGTHGEIINKITGIAGNQKIRISELPRQKLEELTGKDANHQGVAARISDITYYGVEEIITRSKQKEKSLLLLVDSIQDPHNLGAIFRSAECAGADGVILTIHNSAPVNDTVEKTSAGAVNNLKLCKVPNLVNVMNILKEEGYWIYGSSLDTDKNYTDEKYPAHTALVVGNEEKGIRRLVADNCDILIKIPMPGKTQSLNVSVATGVMLFEILRQRG